MTDLQRYTYDQIRTMAVDLRTVEFVQHRDVTHLLQRRDEQQEHALAQRDATIASLREQLARTWPTGADAGGG